MSTITSWQNHANELYNPFEEINKLRLEQSILSPNLFQVTNLSKQEDNSGLWNIDQRAILYPADIPTDENSLITQYLHDYNSNKQLSTAIEVFWSQNKTIIESPSIHSGLSKHVNKLLDGESHETTITTKTSRDQVCQTMLSFPVDFDMYQIPAFCLFMNEKTEKSSAKQLFSDDCDRSGEDSFHSHSASSMDLTNFSEPLGYQDQFSSSPKCKYQNDKDTEVCSTPELSPFSNENLENNMLYFNFQPIQNTEHSKFVLNSPNLSPIKEDLCKITKENESMKPEPNCQKEDPNTRHYETTKSFIDMDVDLGVIIKAPIMQQKSFDNSINNIDDNNNDDDVETKILVKLNDSKEPDRKYFNLNNIETTTNQDQDTGYQTGGVSSTQFNMMDLTYHHESLNTVITSSTASKEPILSLSSLQNINKHIKTERAKISSSVDKTTNNFYKESLTSSLTSFTNLYPLGSSTPERSKSIINVSNNESYSVHVNNKNLNSENLCISLSNSGLYKKRAFKRNISFNENLIKDSFSSMGDNLKLIHESSQPDDLFKCLTNSIIDDDIDSALSNDSLLTMNMLPSEYARSVLDRALQDLNEIKDI